ncbi:MAG: undecaprenyl-diphosphate phosphatase [Spirochaetes bacterium]|nr:undecaprenyl-diphosphate phosphatase [Spirochaetota bacterium]
MNLIEAIVLGFIQGVSEFLPVSSSGHLLVFYHIFGITTDDHLTFLIVLNMGSLLPLLWVFRRDVLAIARRPRQKTTALLAVATLPLVTVTLFFQDFIEAMFHLMDFLPAGFVLTGVTLLLSDRLKKSDRTIEDMRLIDAALIGLAQAAAVFPGISRSGSTITASLARGLDRESAAKFSFLMSVPAAFGAIALRVSHVATGRILLDDLNFANLGAGFVTAAITGYFSINIMLAIVKKAKLKYFALYYIFALVVFILLFL